MKKDRTEVIALGEGMDPKDRETLTKVLDQVEANADAEKEDEVAKDKAEASPCMRCGFIEGKQVPAEEDLAEYMRATLGMRRFLKTYYLMKGQITLELSTVDTKASERMNAVITQLGALEDMLEFKGRLAKLRLIYLLKSYAFAGETKEFEVPMATTAEDVQKEFAERFGELDESLVNMLVRTMNMFVTLKAALMEACFDETFYKGAGPC